MNFYNYYVKYLRYCDLHDGPWPRIGLNFHRCECCICVFVSNHVPGQHTQTFTISLTSDQFEELAEDLNPTLDETQLNVMHSQFYTHNSGNSSENISLHIIFLGRFIFLA